MVAGYRFYTGRSMRTTFRPGDRILFTQVRPGLLRPGDVVIFRTDPDPGIDTVHRIVSVDGRTVTVRGDDNEPDATETVPFESILGRVVTVDRGGRCLPVVGGIAGGLWAGLVSPAGLPRRLAAFLYGVLRRSRIVRLFWRPEVEVIRIDTDQDSVMRLVSSGKTIGKWCPEREILVLKKPWDLVVTKRDCPRQR